MDHKKFQINRMLALCLAILCCTSAMSQDSAAKKRWSFIVEPYLMFPNMNGKTGVGELPEVEVDASVDDIFSHLQIGAMLYFEAANDKWAISSDIIYMDLKQDLKTGVLINSGEANMQQFVWELAGMRRFLPMLEAGIGARYVNLKAGVNFLQNNVGGGTTPRGREMSEGWVDPFLVVRLKHDGVKKFIYQFRGDIGGFGIGSDFTWQIQAFAGYRFSKLFQITGGYRVIGIDYDKGSGQDRFLYDIDTFGPVVRFGFNF